jgi:hypothetical protein
MPHVGIVVAIAYISLPQANLVSRQRFALVLLPLDLAVESSLNQQVSYAKSVA